MQGNTEACPGEHCWKSSFFLILKLLIIMKKIFLVLSLLGMFTFFTPKIATTAEPHCHTIQLVCPNGTHHIVLVCQSEDWYAYGELLCGIVYH